MRTHQNLPAWVLLARCADSGDLLEGVAAANADLAVTICTLDAREVAPPI